MSSVEYSSDAVNVLNKFHRCQDLIYVEGDDDKLFWDVILKKFGIKNYKIEAKDGCDELDKYISRLISEDLNIYVARDSDYIDIIGSFPQHKRLIKTYGYSIENTLFEPSSVAEITKLWIKGNEVNVQEIYDLIDEVLSHIKPVLELDVANYKFDLYVDVLGDNCTRYMKSQSCTNVDGKKVSAHYKKLVDNFTDAQIEQVKEIINNSDLELFEVIRGHFLQSIILKLISMCVVDNGYSQKLSHHALYTNAIQQMKIMFSDEDHAHYDYYKNSIELAFVA
ncbi:hypothetical protein RN22_12725 [Grimontia sp. AD028]|uniref:DUF4435 domain-containing protein n=1 Tax=Grimontia sp. AD028 TaxID=1581149 RepID=UPI00061B4476|nr:DUF4435 domain-containing protein [Grimontia sp. AD028]KKD60179.1 hypothetical protein RN22_12725 [Grimontia sp. AD028]